MNQAKQIHDGDFGTSLRHHQGVPVAVVGAASEAADVLLRALHQLGCAVEQAGACSELLQASRKAAGLVFVPVGQEPAEALYERIAGLLRSRPGLGVVPVVGYADQAIAAALLDLGCVDYLLTPFSPGQVDALLRRQALALDGTGGIVSRSQAGRRLLAMAQRVAQTRAPVLISGETGTGKELMARYIHGCSAESAAPFVAVNCAAIPEQMLESILFGHERGAFTGAVTAQPGKFELANGGTLLLDEIGELPLGLQAKLLRVLQEQRVERLGARRDIRLDVRVIAATNRDLQQEVAEGRFRADLMFRLDVLPLQISPLRERREDILPLARSFVRRYAAEEGRDDLFTDAASRALQAHDWPGNVRELENAVQRALVLRNGLFIQPCDLGLAEPASNAQPAPAPHSAFAGEGRAALRASGKWAEYQHVLETLQRHGGHRTKAAQSLGITTRALRYRINAMREQGVAIPL